MTIRKVFIVLAVLMVLPITFICAQPGGGDDPGNPGGNPAIPIDGGLSWLAAAGLAYGARKLYKRHQETDGIEE